MSSRLAGKGACALPLRLVTNTRLTAGVSLEKRGNMSDQEQPSIPSFDAAAWRSPPTGCELPKEPTRWGILAIGMAALGLIFAGLSYAGYRQALIASGAPDPAIESEGREYIANLLRDPASAQFRKVQVQGECVDGEVNGKNALGGYAGFSEFYYNRKQGMGRIAQDSDGVLKAIDPLQGAIVEANFGFGHSDCLAGRGKQ